MWNSAILLGLSIGIPIFFFGDWEYGLVVGALIWSIGGTLFLVALGLILRLVGIEYDLQKRLRIERYCWIAEDDGNVRPKRLRSYSLKYEDTFLAIAVHILILAG